MRLLKHLKEKLSGKQPEVGGFEFWIEDVHTGVREPIYPDRCDRIAGDRLTVRRIGRIDVYHVYHVVPEGRKLIYKVERIKALRATTLLTGTTT